MVIQLEEFKMNRVGILDYGATNIESVVRAFKRIGVESSIVGSTAEFANISHLVLPGVGSYAYASRTLAERRLNQAITDFVSSGAPTLGICLGLQLLLPKGIEFGNSSGLSLIEGKIEELPNYRAEFHDRKPRIGWYPVFSSPKSKSEFFAAFDGSFFYFAHSYFVRPTKISVALNCSFQNIDIPVAVQFENILGVQFHPEKSGNNGLKLLSRFVSL